MFLLLPRCLSLLSLMLLLCAAPLRAQTPSPAPAPDPQAQAHRNAAKALADKYDYAGANAQLELAYTVDKTAHVQDTATDLNLIGENDISAGQYTEALNYLQQAFPVRREVKDRAGEANTLINIGETYDGLSQSDKALTFLQQGLAIAREVKDGQDEDEALRSLGSVYVDLSQYDKALASLSQALALSKQRGDNANEATALVYFGFAYEHLSQYDKAIDFYQQALSIRREVKDRAGEAITLGNLMVSWKSVNKAGLAVFFGKQAVNVYQSIRQDIGVKNKDSQKSYLEANAKTYRYLADLLISQGRLPEAEQVLALLKQQETFDLLRGDTQDAGPAGQADLTPEEAAQEKIYTSIAGQVTALGQEQQSLEDKVAAAGHGGPALTAAENGRMDVLDTQLAAANSHLTVYFRSLTAAFSAPTAANQTVQQRLTSFKDARDLHRTLHDLHTQGQDVVVLETLVTPDHYAVIVTTAESQKVEQYSIKVEDLNRKVFALQAALRDPNVDPRGPANDLYKIVVGPIEEDLKQAGATTLMWSLDGTLRLIPIAALYDGKQYLVERFSNEVFTLGSQSGLGERAKSAWQGLGLGVSQPPAGSGFDPLPSVPDELHGIIQDSATATAANRSGAPGVLPGVVLLNGYFTDIAMKHALRSPAYNLVHIASHFALHPGDPDSSFLLLGDGSHLSLADFADRTTLFENVDLLSLSACETATGGTGRDGAEVDGLGTIAQNDGAKSVLASLWPVADASTQQLMETFYRRHEAQANVTKAAALQAAQLSLLRGTGPSAAAPIAPRGTQAVADRGESADLPPFVANPKAPYAHPFYWAPFILIGNWR